MLPIGLYIVRNSHMSELSNFLVCRNADDIWLKAMGNMLDIPAVQTSYHSLFLPVQNKNNKTLSSVNLDFGNDVQIEAVRKYCVEHFGKDPFACRG